MFCEQDLFISRASCKTEGQVFVYLNYLLNSIFFCSNNSWPCFISSGPMLNFKVVLMIYYLVCLVSWSNFYGLNVRLKNQAIGQFTVHTALPSLTRALLVACFVYIKNNLTYCGAGTSKLEG